MSGGRAPEPTAAAREQLTKVARGGAVGLVGAVVAGVGGFALALAVANLVPVEEAGTFFAITSLFVLAESLCVLGSDTGLGRFALRLEAHGREAERSALLRTAFTAPMLLSVLVGGGLVLAAPAVVDVLGSPEEAVPGVRVLGAVLPVAVLFQLSLAGTRAYGRMRPTVLADNLLRTGGQPVTVAVTAYLGAGLTALVAAWLLPYLAASTLSVVLLRGVLARRTARRSTDRDAGVGHDGRRGGLAGEYWRFTWPRAIARVSQMALQRVDILIVAALRSPAEAAVYTAATRFVPLGQLGTQALQQVLQPRFTALIAVDDHDTLREVYRVATGWNTLIAWPLYLVAACAPLVYLGLFGPAYAEQGRGVVVVLALAMLLAVAAGPADTVLLMAGRSTWSLGNSVVALALDVVLCFLLVPEHGILGAGIAWALAVVVRNLLGVVQVTVLLRVGSPGRPLVLAATVTSVAVALPLLVADLTVGLDLVLLLVLAPVCLVLLGLLARAARRPLALDTLVAGLAGRGSAAASDRAPRDADPDADQQA